MDPYIRYQRDGELPDGRREGAKIRQKAGKYILIEGELYRMSFGGPHLKCLHPDQAELVMAEIHEGESLGRKAHKAISQGYFWPYMQTEGMSANVISASDTRR